MSNRTTPREKVFAFFEQPASLGAWLFRLLIIALIAYSGVAVALEFFAPARAEQYSDVLYRMEVFLVIVFSAEYLLRLWAAPARGRFVGDFYNLIDLAAILPFFLTGLNLGVIRLLRFSRFARAIKLVRMAKILRHFWQTSAFTTSRVVQENVIKNILVMVGIILVSSPLHSFVQGVDPALLSDVMFATSILALAAMFGFFALSYGDFDLQQPAQRFLIHLTTAFLLLPIGVMFLLIQQILTIQLESFPSILVISIWFVYAAVVLWDFANVLKLHQQLTEAP